jgi:hypothetical protein
LYLFLVCVGNYQGLSYYNDASIAERLNMDAHLLEQARSELINRDLLAWRRPLYQVLSLDRAVGRRSSGALMRLGDILRHLQEAAHD